MLGVNKFYVTLLIVVLAALTRSKNAQAQGCTDPDLSAVGTDTKITLCNGTTVSGTMTAEAKANCTRSGETDCITTATVPAGDSTRLTQQDIQNGSSLGGLQGSMRATKVCKNGLGKHSTSAAIPWNGAAMNGGGTVTINNGSTTVTLAGSNFVWSIGVHDRITVAGQTRTVASVTTTTVLDVTVPFTVSVAGSAWSVTPYVPDDGFMMSDIQTGGTYTGTGRTNCNESNFTDVTSTTSPYKPSGDVAWTNIYRDDLTGVFVTNRLHVGLTLAEAAARCEALNGFATGGTGWRLPTEKEVLQLYIDGAYFVLGNVGRVWNSTAYTNSANWIITYDIGDGTGAGPYARGTLQPMLCLRE